MKKAVLIVDETPAVLINLTMLLEGAGIRVLRARNAPEAKGMLSRQYLPADAVLVNVMMPGSDLSGFVDEVRALRPEAAVVFFSAIVDADVIRIEAMRPPDLSGLTSIDERGILAAVSCALKKPRTRASGRS